MSQAPPSPDPKRSSHSGAAAPQRGGERQALQQLLARADVQLDGNRPWDVQVRDPRLYRRVLAGGSLAFGESYMDGWWDCAALDECIRRILAARLDRQVHSWRTIWNVAKAKLLNLQRPSRAYEVGEVHYDRGNDLFEAMLDERMVYSCGYWRDARTLAEAQEAKLDLVCRKIGLEAGDRVLDIGCGWGSFLKYAAEEYGAEGVGVTVSQAQAGLAREHCKGLPVEIRIEDYRKVVERFDHVVSIGMFEHVGPKNYAVYFDAVRNCLKPGGLFLLETLSAARTSGTTNAWVNKYIFPNGSAPSVQQLAAALEGRFVIEDWHNFGRDYDRTLMVWHERFMEGWSRLESRYDERFRRMWEFYLLGCAGAFRARRNQNWQLVLSPQGAPGGYRSVR